MSVRISSAVSRRKSNSIGLEQEEEIYGSHKQKAQGFRHSSMRLLRCYQTSVSPLLATLLSVLAPRTGSLFPRGGTNCYQESQAQQALQKVSCSFWTVPAKFLGRALIGQDRVT